MPIKICFWNIKQKNNTFIHHLMKVAHDVDILILAESNIDDDLIDKQLNLRRVADINEVFSYSTKHTPKLYTKLSEGILQYLSTSSKGRMCFFNLKTKNNKELILAALHFPSKLHYTKEDQEEYATKYVREINDIERVQNAETILVGDFNMNPFERGMIAPSRFNATLSYEKAKEKKKLRDYKCFYNPMWNWLGDRSYETGKLKEPIGSYYYERGSESIYWNVFDQVIVRPNIIDTIDYTTLRLVDVYALYTDKKPKKEDMSDHYPLVFNLK